MSEFDRPPGKTTIAPEALMSIVQLTTLSVPGVSGLPRMPGSMRRMLSRGAGDGVNIYVEDDVVHADLYVIIHRDRNVRRACRTIQREVARAISKMVGMEVGRLNIHVEGIDFGEGTTL